MTVFEKVSQEKHKSSITIIVYVNNTNDNIPYFVGGPYEAKVSENSPIGIHVTSVIVSRLLAF